MTRLTTNDQTDKEQRKGSYCGTDMCADTTASTSSCCMAQWKGREDEQDEERCGWTTSNTEHGLLMSA